MSFVHNLSLGVTAESAFAAIADLTAIPQWIPSIRSVRLLENAAVGIGTGFEQSTGFVGIPFHIRGVVTEHDPPLHFAYRYHHGVVAGLWTYRITPTAAGCDVEVSIEFTNLHWLRPIVDRIVAANIERFGRWATLRKP